MSKMVQIRNVPDAVHRQAKARAALAGMSLSDYLLNELKRTLERPTRDEILSRIQDLPPVEIDRPIADLVREEREAREEQLLEAARGRRER